MDRTGWCSPSTTASRDVYDNAWPLLRERGLPFTVYLTTAYVGGAMRWEGSTAKEQGAPGLTWDQLREMVDSGLCTVGNHTHTHARPEQLTVDELDRCSELVERELGVVPRHFAYTWGVPVPARCDRAARPVPDVPRPGTGAQPARDRPDGLAPGAGAAYRPDPVLRAKLRGDLLPERAYGGIVAAAKKAGLGG